MNIDLHAIQSADHPLQQRLIELWNGACGPDFALSSRFFTYSLQPMTGLIQAGRVAMAGQQILGFILCSALPSSPAARPGWIDALAVGPENQRQGVGSHLLGWAEAWLAEQGVDSIRVGAGMAPFLPGVPASLASASFFSRHDYQIGDPVWDVARNLADYRPPSCVHPIEGAVRPAQPGQESELVSFLARSFPGRWHDETVDSLARGGRLADFMLLWREEGVAGFCQLTFADSLRPLERFYPYRLPRPWGQLGPIGVAAEHRGKGYGAALLDGGLRRLHANGVNGCVIDWTDLLALYAKFGFAPYTEYVTMLKVIANRAESGVGQPDEWDS